MAQQSIVIYSDVIRGFNHVGFALVGEMTEEAFINLVKEYFANNKQYTIFGYAYKGVSQMLEVLEYRHIDADDKEAITTLFGDKMDEGVFATFPVGILDPVEE